MKQKKALIFEDDELLQELLTRILTDEQFEVTAFSNPTNFIAQCKRCHHRVSDPCFDVLITDNMMPSMSGIEFLEILKDVGCKLADHRKAICSGAWSADDLNRARKCSAKVFDKPYQMDELIQWVVDCRKEKIPL